MASSIAVFGDIFCDIVASSMSTMPNWGEDVLAPIRIVAGGSGLNTTLHAAAFAASGESGVRMTLFSAVGDDAQGIICQRALHQDYVDSRVVIRPDLQTGTCIVLSGQDRGFVTDRGCIQHMSLEWFPCWVNGVEEATHVHCAGYYNCDNMKPHWEEIFQKARSRGVGTSVNPQFDASGQWDGVYDLCPWLDLIFCNEHEAHAMAGCTSSRQAASEFLRRGCRYVVITSSGNGATVYSISPTLEGVTTNMDDVESNIMECHQKAFPIEEVVDTTGAGDAFIGTFLVEWVQSRGNIQRSLRAGCIGGALAVQMTGGSTTPSSDSIREMLNIE
mmetsp:Transcript_12589/g.19017  ORF Transcript_12589/g.19017 Transcript_12589/m.19017 type:complete len:331 (+) Transcript_12589:172-1164(+)|eukprot:CAMPEP_0185032576 /NCGR_PEP_ID=MMETSP1103-20130426/20754_1 /TAXON_ID=36769 /ORGANISM="Paraphysomonas bandaiensis, Strain Caron Lab Isolate" /LENGTH=330 /DNA_ID=CAMNT_0027568525 /DNA_START=99 /DNA_END=1091 /DNA_ORIENTATION=-